MRVERPSLETAAGRLTRRGQAMERTPGQWIIVGTFPGDAGTVPESPPFQNSWLNSGVDGVPPASFYIDKYRRVHVRGGFDGGALGTVIFTLPPGYRPAFSDRYVCAGDTGVTILQVDPNGDVIQVL